MTEPTNSAGPPTPEDDEDDEEEGEEGSEVEGIDPPTEQPKKETTQEEMLHRIVLELVEIKTSLAVLHHKFNQTLAGRVMRWFNDRM